MRVKAFPPPAPRCTASDSSSPAAVCAANAAVAVARLGARVQFAGRSATQTTRSANASSPISKPRASIAAAPCALPARTASVSLILLDALGEKTIATRRGVKLGNVVPADAAKLVEGADAVLIDNRFPEFVTAVCRAATKRRLPIVVDLDHPTKANDPLLTLGTHVIASAEALRATTGRRRPCCGAATPGQATAGLRRRHRRAAWHLLARSRRHAATCPRST